MSMKVEPGTPATTAVTSNPKISTFATKVGFVIPKNKLSGSLVSISRGNKKLGGGKDSGSEENSKQQTQRRTKWGPDLTQDPIVRKGRTLAYQTRVDQITQYLKLGSLDLGDHQDSPMESSHATDPGSLVVQFKSEEFELLELERREAIGEILKLNPTYKAPADYKPLLKEAKVLIPIKEYPGYNFIGLIFGSTSDTQKRLEKETGAKIRVYGTKGDTCEKSEITPDANEQLSIYKEVYVHVCADTYEKVDAAVALIELLLTRVSVTPTSTSTASTVASGDTMNVINPTQGTPTLYTPAPSALDQGALSQPIIGRPPPPHTQFNPYPTPPPWYPTGGPPSSQNPPQPIYPPLQPSSSSSSPSNMISLFGQHPPNPNFDPTRPPQQTMLQGQRPPYMPPHPPPQNFIGPTRTPSQPNLSNFPPFTGAPHNVRPLGAAPVVPQSTSPSTFLPRPPANSVGWSQPLAGPPPASNTGGLHPVSATPSLHNMNSPFRPPPTYPSFVPSQMPTQTPNSSMSPMQHVVARPNSMFNSSQIPLSLTSASRPSPQLGNPNYVPETASSFTSVKPPTVSAPVPLQPSSNDFTFHPRRPPPQNFPVHQPPPPQTPSFRPAMQSSVPPPAMQSFQRPLPYGPLRHQGFQNQGPVPAQMGSRNFGPSPFQTRPSNPMPLQQNYHTPTGTRPPNFGGEPTQQRQAFPLGTQQIYDPFSPTSVPQVGGSKQAKVGKQESDPEYEDLMASVGVK